MPRPAELRVFKRGFKKQTAVKVGNKCQEVWTMVKNNQQALTRKYNELGKSEKSSIWIIKKSGYGLGTLRARIGRVGSLAAKKI